MKQEYSIDFKELNRLATEDEDLSGEVDDLTSRIDTIEAGDPIVPDSMLWGDFDAVGEVHGADDYDGPFPVSINSGETYTATMGDGNLMIQGYGFNEYTGTTINITLAGWIVAKVTRSSLATIVFENVATVTVESSFFTFPIAKIIDNGLGKFSAKQGETIYVGAYV